MASGSRCQGSVNSTLTSRPGYFLAWRSHGLDLSILLGVGLWQHGPCQCQQRCNRHYAIFLYCHRSGSAVQPGNSLEFRCFPEGRREHRGRHRHRAIHCQRRQRHRHQSYGASKWRSGKSGLYRNASIQSDSGVDRPHRTVGVNRDGAERWLHQRVRRSIHFHRSGLPRLTSRLFGGCKPGRGECGDSRSGTRHVHACRHGACRDQPSAPRPATRGQPGLIRKRP